MDTRIHQVSQQIRRNHGMPQAATDQQIAMAIKDLRRDGWFEADMEQGDVDALAAEFKAYYQGLI